MSGGSDRTIRRRIAQWAERDIAQQVHALALRPHNQINEAVDYPDGVWYEEWTLAGSARYQRPAGTTISPIVTVMPRLC
jgi:hypothetical protein